MIEVTTSILMADLTSTYMAHGSPVSGHIREWDILLLPFVGIVGVEAVAEELSKGRTATKEVERITKIIGYCMRSVDAFQAMWVRAMVRMIGLARMARMRIRTKEVMPNTASGMRVYGDEVYDARMRLRMNVKGTWCLLRRDAQDRVRGI
jgi:hypothetical protein